MTVALDTSALVTRYVNEPGRELVAGALADDPDWCVSEIARSELLILLHRIAVDPAQAVELDQRARLDWEHFAVVPVDDRCLARAVEIGTTYRVRMVDAIHLAAAHRLPQPVRFVTFDRRQIPAAVALGFDVVAPADR
ncbi:MAG: type II toxin-antitoxin system VapC family toxin [Actinomycetia bacterium]|nr:type II toxin-antitoxin system VapC family toxin [Actinomycetes bacterium]MCP3912381.1 type II toxin-antitoxin system VapC family toxin [Actinomycetes bacterium]